MSVTIIDNFTELARARLIEQYKESKNLNILLDSLIEQVQKLEDNTFKLFSAYDLSSAIDRHLDNLGAVVGEQRYGREDDVYRVAIAVRIFINSSGCDPDSILTAVRLILNPLKLNYSETYPAAFSLYIQTPNFIQGIRDFLSLLAPAGVKIDITYSNDGLPFVTSEIVNVFRYYGVNSTNDDTLQVEDETGIYNFVVSVEEPVEDDFGDGFSEITLTEFTYNTGDAQYSVGDRKNLRIRFEGEHEFYQISDYGGELAEIL